MKIISFFGHSDCECQMELREKIKEILQDCISHHGAEIFYFGGFGAFDNLCWEIVTELKNNKYPKIKRVFCVPIYKWLRRPPKWLNVGGYEELIYLDLTFDYWYTSLYFRNCAMIDKSDFVIFYVMKDKRNSGSFKALQYAKKKKKNYINLL